MRKAKHFLFCCKACAGTGLRSSTAGVYGVEVCGDCNGSGRGRWTISERIAQLGGLLYERKEG